MSYSNIRSSEIKHFTDKTSPQHVYRDENLKAKEEMLHNTKVKMLRVCNRIGP